MRVEIVDAAATPARRIEVDVAAGSTVAAALTAAGLAVPSGGAVTSSGRLRRLDEPLMTDERLEVCQPLRADPKQARRMRARRQRL